LSDWLEKVSYENNQSKNHCQIPPVCVFDTGGQRLNPAFVSDIEKKVLSRTVEMETDQKFNEGLARLGRSGFHFLRGRNFLH
jgi:hypothetical protein